MSDHFRVAVTTGALLAALLGVSSSKATTSEFCTTASGPQNLPNPILFVTQMPIAADFATIGSVFANHTANLSSAGRGGDLYIRYPNRQLCNLTAEGGFGNSGFQGTSSIAVRDPAVHWSGNKAIFSMAIGAPTQQFQTGTYYWQLYEVTGLAPGEPVSITKVPNQPQQFNNVNPIYGSDDRIIFTSDRPRNGARHLYPQHDEYESTPTNTGLWSLNPTTNDLILLQHSPSGSFDPSVDSFGRIIFSRWDHLERDQQADADADSPTFGTFNYSDESAFATRLNSRAEVFPEPRPVRDDLLAGTNLLGHGFNHFFPWMINQDGSEEETLNHIGRHELHRFFTPSLNDDDNLEDFVESISGRQNPNPVFNVLQIREDPAALGRYLAVDAPEFQTHASGQIVAMVAPPERSPELIQAEYVTHPDTGLVTDSPGPNHSGHYRDPLPLSDGGLLATHTAQTGAARNNGTRANPQPRYDFKIKQLVNSGSYRTAGASITGGISKTLSYYDPDVLVSYNGDLWEMSAVEVRPRPAPTTTVERSLALPERTVFDEVGIDEADFRNFLRLNDLGLMVVRDVTSRDLVDEQQPYNLRVPGGIQSIGSTGTIYDVAHLQMFQGDQIRGIGGIDTPRRGRRVLAQPMHEPATLEHNLPNPGGPVASVAVASDGSAAAFVPARRAMSWQITAPDGTPVVRERYWITFQPGEVRVCDGCHGVNDVSQVGLGPAQNDPQALTALLENWQAWRANFLFTDDFE